ncbi:Alkyl hydroperoxide reductase subunit C-like protein [hydrothermal vent metagenome]|uniref:Alkyl hydroperoxide reductase subunit C-like protein n=1 Tax=hydrothermal vent metagenome TaxID=652676 RepID=A0A3B0WTN2_9ZZZZ
MKDLYQLPEGLPVPVDDGACNHLEGAPFPSMLITVTPHATYDFSKEKGINIIFFYPMIGHPDSLPMTGWNEIPGARGCTPQALSYKNYFRQITKLGVRLFGASSQALKEQNDAIDRLKLPFELINDSSFLLSNALKLPTFQFNEIKMIKRLTLVVVDGVIKKVFYPVFPPNKNVDDVIVWLKEN